MTLPVSKYVATDRRPWKGFILAFELNEETQSTPPSRIKVWNVMLKINLSDNLGECKPQE